MNGAASPQRVIVERDSGRVLLCLPPDERERAEVWLEEAGYEPVVAVDDTEAATLVAERHDLDVVVTAVPQNADQNAILAAAESPAGLEVIVVGPEDVLLITQAMSFRQVYSYLSRPLTERDLVQHVARAFNSARDAQLAEDRRRELPAKVEFQGLVGTSPRMREVMDTLRRAAPSDAPVVIRGETGTGKELLATAVHASSPRASGPFVAVHLHATPAGLVESELFGHKKGAFTGAHSDRVGKLELADGGTLFLDELGDIPLETQVKLLRVLETSSFAPVGSNKSVRSDFRLVTATNQDIEAMIAEKKFREELWYRLKVIEVELPALRERKADIPALAERFAFEFAERSKKKIEGIDPEVLGVLQGQPWPGNVRDLRNVIWSMVVLADGPRLTLRDLPRELRGQAAELPAAPGAPTSGEGGSGLAGRPMHELELEAIKATLELTGGNRKAAAEMLQIGERTLYRKIEKYGL